MKALLILVSAFFSCNAFSQNKTETRELVGQVGSRSALLVLQATQRPDGGWQVSGEYILLPTMVRRYVEGERSPEIGVTTLKEGSSAILFGRPPTGELRGTWRGGRFSGSRYGTGGQERERFEFSEEFPSMEGYSASVRCEAGEDRYGSSLAYLVEAGKLRSFDWRSRVAPSDHACAITAVEQQPGNRIRYRPEGQKGTEVVHTLNGTAVTDRWVLAILENFRGDVPDALKPFGAPDRVAR